MRAAVIVGLKVRLLKVMVPEVRVTAASGFITTEIKVLGVKVPLAPRVKSVPLVPAKVRVWATPLLVRIPPFCTSMVKTVGSASRVIVSPLKIATESAAVGATPPQPCQEAALLQTPPPVPLDWQGAACTDCFCQSGYPKTIIK